MRFASTNRRGAAQRQRTCFGSRRDGSGVGCGVRSTWVRKAEVDGGNRTGLTTEERERMKLLERENRELRQANEILKSAAAFFGAELDRRSSR